MSFIPVIGGMVYQAPNARLLISHGYTNAKALHFVLPGDLAKINLSTEPPIPGPPTIAPVLTVEADIGSLIAHLTWTPSDQTDVSGFRYDVYAVLSGGFPELIGSTTDLFFFWSTTMGEGNHDFWVMPVNDLGEGPISNVFPIALPGGWTPPVESVILLNSGGNILLNSGGNLLLNV